jgi:predicted N-formylglutamate amidohydrolase
MSSLSNPASNLLLCASDGAPCRVIHAAGALPLLLLCDHASNRIPARLNNLGLTAGELAQHFAVDIGAERVTEILATQLGVAAVLGNFSRLVVDCNRDPSHPQAMTPHEDGTIIPGNQDISAAERQARLDEIFHPFHTAVAEQITQLEQKFGSVMVVGVHSFTPQYRHMAAPRPWQIGILWHRDISSGRQLIDYLRHTTAYTVGDNQPYTLVPENGQTVTYTLEHHAETPGRRCFQVEIRQDEIGDESGCVAYATLLAQYFIEALKQT